MVTKEEFEKLQKRVLSLEKIVINLLVQKTNELCVNSELLKQVVKNKEKK